MDKTIARAPAARQRLQADERRKQILRCGFAMIAESGLENFRTRDVADRAGINSATLHHYFPTKEALIEGVAAHLEGRYRELRSAAAPELGATPALQALRREFADARCLREEHSDMLAVSAEFLLQARRDRTAARVISSMHQHWRAQIESIVRDGQSAGVFGLDLEPVAASMVVVGALWSATGLFHASSADFDRLCAELESWLRGSGQLQRDGAAK
jgi:AcrR family transcriptional regulator